METNSKMDYLRIKSNYRKLGLLYGIIVGLAYGLSTWGFDAITLFRVHATLPWLKISLGLLFCVSVGGIAGLLVGNQDRGIVAVIIWALVGSSFAWITGHSPFDISSTLNIRKNSPSDSSIMRSPPLLDHPGKFIRKFSKFPCDL